LALILAKHGVPVTVLEAEQGVTFVPSSTATSAAPATTRQGQPLQVRKDHLRKPILAEMEVKRVFPFPGECLVDLGEHSPADVAILKLLLEHAYGLEVFHPPYLSKRLEGRRVMDDGATGLSS